MDKRGYMVAPGACAPWNGLAPCRWRTERPRSTRLGDPFLAKRGTSDARRKTGQRLKNCYFSPVVALATGHPRRFASDEGLAVNPIVTVIRAGFGHRQSGARPQRPPEDASDLDCHRNYFLHRVGKTVERCGLVPVNLEQLFHLNPLQVTNARDSRREQGPPRSWVVHQCSAQNAQHLLLSFVGQLLRGEAQLGRD